MAAGVLPRPGTKYGPCKPVCEHRDCAETRRQAAMLCRICGKKIGYGVPFFQEQSYKVLVHAECAWEEDDKERNQ